MAEPLTDEMLAAMEASFNMAAWHKDYRNGLRLIAEVRRLRAERREAAGLLWRCWACVSWGQGPSWSRLCELFPEMKETT